MPGQINNGKVLQFENLEQVKDFLTNDESGQKLFLDLVSVKYIEKSHINGLTVNRDKILEEKKTLQEKYKEQVSKNEALEAEKKEVEKKLDTVDEAEYNRLVAAEKAWLENHKGKSDGSAELDALQAKINNNETIYRKKTENFEKVIAEKDVSINTLTNTIDDYTITQSITTQMDQAMIDEEARPMVFDAFRGRASIEVDELGEKHVVMKDRQSVKLPIADFFTAWTNDDANKRFIKAPDHSGGGSGTNNNAFGGVSIDELQNQINEAQKENDTVKAILLKKQKHELQKRLNGRPT